MFFGLAVGQPRRLNHGGSSLNIVDINLLATSSATGSVVAAVGVAVLVELEGAVAVLGAAKGVGLVDLGRLGQLAVGFEGAGFVGCVLEAVDCGLVWLVMVGGEKSSRTG